jgi:uncharacterized protein (TIGR02996 family)
MIETEQTALLQRILEAPADDIPRLIYADWLEEKGQDKRAEFIRVSCRLHIPQCQLWPRCLQIHHFPFVGGAKEISQCINCVQRAKGIQRERELLSAGIAPGGFLEAETLVTGMPAPSGILWRRGFMHTIQCTWDTWKECGPSTVQQQPIEEVEIAGLAPSRDYGQYCWNAHHEHGIPPESVLPRELVNPMSAVVGKNNGSAVGNLAMFPSLKEALAALSDACLIHAKSPQWSNRRIGLHSSRNRVD